MKSLIAVCYAIAGLQLIAGDVHVYVKDVGYRITGINAKVSGGQPTPRHCINFCYSQADIRDSLKSFDFKRSTSSCNCQIVDKFTNPEAFDPDASMDEYTIIHQDDGELFFIRDIRRSSHNEHLTSAPALPAGAPPFTHGVAVVSATYTIPAPITHSRQSDCGYLCLATPGCNAFIRSVNGVNFDCTLINNIE